MKIKGAYNQGLYTIFAIVQGAGYDIRIVGGYVRDSIVGESVDDIDLATTATPQEIQDILLSNNIMTIPTGISHGTITAVVDTIPYEITTLRTDVSTDGRHATVDFIDDWQGDALRRDFTINALYADLDGTVYDYVGGLSDLANKRLVFCGDADKRVSEDYLRILRYYRFLVQTGFDGFSVERASCSKGAKYIKNVSIERIHSEMIKMLSYPRNPKKVLSYMVSDGVLSAVVPFAVTATFPLLSDVIGASTDKYAKIIALCNMDCELVMTLSNFWKMSNADKRYLRNCMQVLQDRAFVSAFVHKYIYYYGADVVHTAMRIKFRDSVDVFTKIEREIATWRVPTLPISGDDLIKIGFRPSPALGAMLKSVERWWVDNAFKPKMQDCLLWAKQRSHIKR